MSDTNLMYINKDFVYVIYCDDKPFAVTNNFDNMANIIELLCRIDPEHRFIGSKVIISR